MEIHLLLLGEDAPAGRGVALDRVGLLAERGRHRLGEAGHQRDERDEQERR